MRNMGLPFSPSSLSLWVTGGYILRPHVIQSSVYSGLLTLYAETHSAFMDPHDTVCD